MNASGVLERVWLWVKWPVIVLAVGFVAFAIWGTMLALDKDKTDAAVAQIHAQKLTLADVVGANLPSVPDQAENDATVAGIDTNNNGIRDDVELAIFAKYPNSPQIRAAALQYAMAEQMYLTRVFNEGTWGKVAEEADRAFFCIMSLRPGEDYGSYIFARTYAKEVEGLIFNTQSRKNAREAAFEFTTSYGSTEKETCDVDLNTLPK